MGNLGYKHWQVRIQTGMSFEDLEEIFNNAHIEECSDTWNYERKEGKFYASDDNENILRCRFGELRDNQRRILETVERNNDRQITCVIDNQGNTGKSWLCRHLYENGTGFYCPPTITTAQGLIQFIASGYNGERIIVIDVPRSTKWTRDLYTVIEVVKDGLIYDTRYSSKTRDIYGALVLVMTNSVPRLDNLSKDRWVLIGADGKEYREP